MESTLTKQEIDAALQLMQLSGSSVDQSEASLAEFRGGEKGKVFVKSEETNNNNNTRSEETLEEGQSSTSVVMNPHNSMKNVEGEDDDEILPRRFSRFGSLAEIYQRTETLASMVCKNKKTDNNRGKKRTRV